MILYKIIITFQEAPPKAVWFASHKQAKAAKRQIEKEYDENIRRCEEPVVAVRIGKGSTVSNQELADWINTREMRNEL